MAVVKTETVSESVSESESESKANVRGGKIKAGKTETCKYILAGYIRQYVIVLFLLL